MKLLLLLFLLFIVSLILFYKAYKNTHEVAFKKIHLSSIDSFDSTSSLAILHISDMHLENISISPEQLYNKLAGERIDLIALTGDFLDKKRSIPRLIPYLDMLNRLNPQYGMYAVFGNHDYRLSKTDFNSLKNVLEKHGCKTLQNAHETILVEGKPLNIIGVDDFHTKKSDLQASFSDVKEGYRLVLTHDPNIVLGMESYAYHYLLAGHFHGGQIYWPKPYHLAKLGRTMMRMDMIKGLHYYHEKPLYISEGLGQTSINIRVGSRPEITLHELSLNTAENEKTLTAV